MRSQNANSMFVTNFLGKILPDFLECPSLSRAKAAVVPRVLENKAAVTKQGERKPVSVLMQRPI